MNYTQLQEIIKFIHNIPNPIIGYSYDTYFACEAGEKRCSGYGVCRCEKIENVQIISIKNDNLINCLSFLDKIDIPIVLNIFSKYGFYDMKNWSPWIVKDYYGEIIADIYLDDDIKNEIIHQMYLLYDSCFYDEYPEEIPCK